MSTRLRSARAGPGDRWGKEKLKGDAEASSLSPHAGALSSSPLCWGSSFSVSAIPTNQPNTSSSEATGVGVSSTEGKCLSALYLGDAEKETTWGQPEGAYPTVEKTRQCNFSVPQFSHL